MAEAGALYFGIKLTLSLKAQKLVIKRDPLNIILALKKFQATFRSIDYIIQEVKEFLINFIEDFNILHCYKEANKLVDLGANNGYNLLEGEHIVSGLQIKEDFQLYDQVLLDASGNG